MSFPIRSRARAPGCVAAWARRWLGLAAGAAARAGRGRRAPARARPLAGHRRRLPGLSHAGRRRQAICRRLSHQQSAGRHLRQQHHAFQDGGHRRLQRGGFCPRAARGRAQGRAAVSGHALRPHPDHRRGHEGAVRLFHEGRGAGGPARSGHAAAVPVQRAGLDAGMEPAVPGQPALHPGSVQERAINRGAYLANALAHCGSCHTPRNALMAEDAGRALGGGPSGRGTRRTSARIPSPASAAGRRTNWCSTCAPAASPARPRPVA